MVIKDIIFEDFVNYKKASMLIAFPKCDTFKCGRLVCQNGTLTAAPDIIITSKALVEKYLKNPISHACVMQGLEPFDSWNDLQDFVKEFRTKTNDDIVIYTGYNKCEIQDKIRWLQKYKNIIVKFGRYIPGQKPHYDAVLGVELASDNQYAEKIS